MAQSALPGEKDALAAVFTGMAPLQPCQRQRTSASCVHELQHGRWLGSHQATCRPGHVAADNLLECAVQHVRVTAAW